MGLLKKLFGGASADDLRQRGERLFEADDFGGAKLAYDKALAKAGEDERPHLQERINACLDGLASRAVHEAERLLEQGEPDLARQELVGALEIVVGDKVRARAQEVVDRLEREDAVDAVQGAFEMSEEEQLTILSSSWEEPQAEEYETYGEDFLDAMVLLARGAFADARDALEAILEEAKAPRYLWLEIGRARILAEDTEGGAEALEEFLDSLAEDEVGEPRLAAHVELARLADKAGDFEAAMAQYQAAVEGFEHDPRPYFMMGRFLRESELPTEAIDVLEAAAAVMDQPDWRILEELGLAHRDADQREKAIAHFEEVVSFWSNRQNLDFPPSSTRPLAELHEEAGKLERAADLYAALARGTDTKNHFVYHREAGRLLGTLGMHDEALRMLKRAIAIADSDEDRAEAEAELARISTE